MIPRKSFCTTNNDETVKEFDGEKFICLQEDWRRYKDPSTFRIQRDDEGNML